MAGKPQEPPEPRGLTPLKGRLKSFNIGSGRYGKNPLVGMIDELRISEAGLYESDFSLPESLSRNYGQNPPTTSRASGPPLLFSGTKTQFYNIGSRKHLFLDEAMDAN